MTKTAKTSPSVESTVAESFSVALSTLANALSESKLDENSFLEVAALMAVPGLVVKSPTDEHGRFDEGFEDEVAYDAFEIAKAILKERYKLLNPVSTESFAKIDGNEKEKPRGFAPSSRSLKDIETDDFSRVAEQKVEMKRDPAPVTSEFPVVVSKDQIIELRKSFYDFCKQKELSALPEPCQETTRYYRFNVKTESPKLYYLLKYAQLAIKSKNYKTDSERLAVYNSASRVIDILEPLNLKEPVLKIAKKKDAEEFHQPPSPPQLLTPEQKKLIEDMKRPKSPSKEIPAAERMRMMIQNNFLAGDMIVESAS